MVFYLPFFFFLLLSLGRFWYKDFAPFEKYMKVEFSKDDKLDVGSNPILDCF